MASIDSAAPNDGYGSTGLRERTRRHASGLLRRICLLVAMFSLITAHARAQPPLDETTATKTRYAGTVAIWYGSHFEDSIQHDWVPIKEWNGPFHPLLGEYRTDDLDVVRQHLHWLRRAGVDLILYDVCRIQSELTLLDLSKQKTLQLIAAELSHQQGETRPLKLALWIEKWNSNPTPEQYRFGLEYIREHLADRDFYFRVDGKPLVITYLNRPSPEIDAIDRENESRFALQRVSPSRNQPGWQYLGPAGDQACMTVNPGADGYMEHAFITQVIRKQPVDVEKLRAHAPKVLEQRAGGKLFAQQLLAARGVDPRVIFISGWNDWAYCLQIEPAREYGFTYVDMAARLLGREAETRPYRQMDRFNSSPGSRPAASER